MLGTLSRQLHAPETSQSAGVKHNLRQGLACRCGTPSPFVEPLDLDYFLSLLLSSINPCIAGACVFVKQAMLLTCTLLWCERLSRTV